LRAVSVCVIATAARDLIDRDSLASLAGRHHQEGPDKPSVAEATASGITWQSVAV